MDLSFTHYTAAEQHFVVQLLEDKLEEEAGWPEEERSLFKLDGIGMWTKLRPGVRAMLAQLAPLFQLWIFTNGTRCVRMLPSMVRRFNSCGGSAFGILPYIPIKQAAWKADAGPSQGHIMLLKGLGPCLCAGRMRRP